jgi:hypothetical protein
VCYDAWAWASAAEIVDSGFRKLGSSAGNERPGAIYLESDSYYWLSYARRISAGETLRVRYTFADNTPFGRPVHWSQSISWLLVLFGKLRQSITGENWIVALEKASVWVNPVLLIVLISGIGLALFKRIGAIPAALFMVYFVSLGDVGWEFQPLRPDHQSLQALFGIFMLAGLVFGGAGWIRIGNAETKSILRSAPLEIPDMATARRWFFLSALCAALGLWISAVVAIMLLLMLFVAVVLLAYAAPDLPEDSNIRAIPELWRMWGWVGGVGSLFFYFLEYFPHHLGFRLEVNGPFYSLAVVAMGESLCQFMRARYARRGETSPCFVKGLICATLVALLPLAILFGPPSWHTLKDPQMFHLHNLIQEFYSFPRFAGPRLGAIFVQNFGILPLFILLAIGLAAFCNLRLVEWAVVWLSFATTVGLLLLGYLQVRWLGLFAGMNAWLAVVTAVCAWRILRERLSEKPRLVAAILFVGLLLIQPIWFATRRVNQVRDIIHQRSLPKQLADPVLNKRLALAFVAGEGPGASVMGELDLAPAFHYFAQATFVASFYWENVAGLHAATRFFADSDGNAARKVALERSVTHVAVQEGNRLQNFFYFIAKGKADQEAAKKLFAARLVGNEFDLPPWLSTTPTLTNIGFQPYTYGGMQFEERCRLYRVAR